jgi:hypothetical protein
VKKKAVLTIFCNLVAGTVIAQGLRLPDKPRPVADSSKVMPARTAIPRPLPSIKYNYYQSLGAACKVELKLEQATRVPFRFRLGSLQQTDYLEQKPNAQRPQQ